MNRSDDNLLEDNDFVEKNDFMKDDSFVADNDFASDNDFKEDYKIIEKSRISPKLFFVLGAIDIVCGLIGAKYWLMIGLVLVFIGLWKCREQ